MKKVPLFVAVNLTAWFVNGTAFADPKVERVTVMLSGAGCRAFQERVETVVSSWGGIRAVDRGSIPDHVLVDVDIGRLSPDQLIVRMKEMISANQSCRVEVMESCISALSTGPRVNVPRSGNESEPSLLMKQHMPHAMDSVRRIPTP